MNQCAYDFRCVAAIFTSLYLMFDRLKVIDVIVYFSHVLNSIYVIPLSFFLNSYEY